MEITWLDDTQIGRLLLVAPHVQLVHHEKPLQQSELRRTEPLLVNHRLGGFEEVVIVLLEDILL